jgi:hypothetical protein
VAGPPASPSHEETLKDEYEFLRAIGQVYFSEVTLI